MKPLRAVGFLILMTMAPLALAQMQPRLNIVASIKPVQLMVLAVVGDSADVDVLLSPQLSPHDYQFRPSDREKLNRADAVFWIGPGLELFLERPLATLPSRTRVVALQENAVGDPHIWMDPLQTAALIRKIAEILGALAPAHREQWLANAERSAAALAAQDASLRAQFAALRAPRPYLVVHDAYSRFENRYGLRHAAALSDHSEKPPGARHVLEIRQLLDSGGIQCVLREPQHEPRVLQTLLQGRNVREQVVDGLAGDIAPEPAAIVQFYKEFGGKVLACLRD